MDLFDESELNEPVLHKEIEVSFGIDGYRFYQGFRNGFDAMANPVEVFLTLIIVKGEEKIVDSNLEGYVHLQNTDQALEFVRRFARPYPGADIHHFIKEERVLEDSEWEEEYRRTFRESLSDGFTEDVALNDCLELISRSKFEELKALGLFEARVNILEDTPNTFSIERWVCPFDNKINKIRETVRSDGYYEYEVLEEIKPEGYKIELPRVE
jgi:hypothetical protein